MAGALNGDTWVRFGLYIENIFRQEQMTYLLHRGGVLDSDIFDVEYRETQCLGAGRPQTRPVRLYSAVWSILNRSSLTLELPLFASSCEGGRDDVMATG